MPDLPDLDEAVRLACYVCKGTGESPWWDSSTPGDKCIHAGARQTLERAAPLIGAAYLEQLAAALDAEREEFEYGRDDGLVIGVVSAYQRAAALARGVAAHCRATAARPATDRDTEPRADADTGTNRDADPNP